MKRIAVLILSIFLGLGLLYAGYRILKSNLDSAQRRA